MFGKRLLSGIIILAVMIFTVIPGGRILFSLITAISVVGLYELYRSSETQRSPLAVIAYITSILLDVAFLLQKEEYMMAIIILFFMFLISWYVFSYPKYQIEQVSFVFFGLFYVTMMLSYVYRIRMSENGILLVWLIFIGAWGSDTCAYCVGVLLGKHKLPSKLSPNKSIEGCIGGVIGATIIGAIYANVLGGRITIIHNPVLAFSLIGGVSSVLAQIGDLAASGIKRNHNIKDYGNLIPGHGGILDRFDSIIYTAPVVFFLSKIL